MILSWFNFFLSKVGELFAWLDDFEIFPDVSALAVIVVVAVAGILTNTFVSVGRR